MTRKLFNIVLLAILAALVLVFALTFASTGSHGGLGGSYDPQALIVHERLHLSQSAPLWNTYSYDEVSVLEGSSAGGFVVVDAQTLPAPSSTMGATDCQVRATLDARYGEVEGVTTTVYDLDFEGTYLLRYTGPLSITVLQLVFPFPAGLDTLNQVYFLVDGEEPPGVQYSLGGITWWTQLESGEEQEVVVRYRARGVGSFRYALDHNRRLENLDVEIAVRGLTGSEVPEEFLSPTAVESAEGGEQFFWKYDALIADRDVQITLPIQSGSVQRLEELQEPLRKFSQASPLFVILFTACLVAMLRLNGVQLPLLHHLLAALGFFLFYPAVTFLCYVVASSAAVFLAAVAVTVLLVFFIGRAAGWRRTWWQTLLLCMVFLGLFSLGTMSRFRGLMFTSGGLLLVGAFMVLLARYRPPKPPEPEPEPPQEIESDAEQKDAADDLPVPETQEVAAQAPEPVAVPPPSPPVPSRYCPHCGGALDEGFSFCPVCGHDANVFRRCYACGAEHYVSPDASLPHCPACGEPLANWDELSGAGQ
jgi:hypothetical protein